MTDMGMIGQTIDHYRIERLLGQGGMGSVFQALDLHLQRPVAIKVMHSHLAARQEFQQRFLQEARAAARLDHPHIIRVLTFGLRQEQLFLVMELVTGGSLRGYLQRLYEQRLFIELPEALEMTRQVADALHYAHQQGMVHRDIKPDNVLLKLVTDSGAGTGQFRAVLTDFGLAKLAEGGVMSVTGQPMGTYPYMSPEQCLAENVDSRTDIYALGIMLYELTVGRLPFQPKSITEAIRMHTREPIPSPTSIRPGLPPELVEVINRSLQKNPDERFHTAGEMARGLRGVQEAIAGGKTTMPETPLTRVDSLATYLMSQPLGAQMPAYTPQPVAPGEAGHDRLIIVTEGQPTRAVPIRQNVLRIGRTPDNDLPLNAEKVSRHHARIERGPDGRYRITDLGSTNGTWLGDARLLSNTPEVWEFGQAVRIGNFWLKIEAASGQPATRAYSMSPVGAGRSLVLSQQPGATVLQSSTGQLAVAVAPTNVEVEAGSRADIQVEILNQGDIVDHFAVQVRGLPNEWATVPKEPLQLLPGDRGTVPVSFHPPRQITSAAGHHNFELRVGSREQRSEVASMRGTLHIAPFHGFNTDLQPKRLQRKGEAVLAITNTGNAAGNYAVSARDRENGLNFNIGQTHFSLEPGQTGHVPVRIAPKSRPFIGAQKLVPFEVAVSTLEGGQQTQMGEMIVPPVLPYWVLGALAFLVVLCLALFGLAMNSGLFQPAGLDQTSTATAATGIAQLTLDAVQNAMTRDAMNFANTLTAEAQATAQAAQLTQQAAQNAQTLEAIFAANTLTAQAQVHVVETNVALTLTANAALFTLTPTPTFTPSWTPTFTETWTPTWTPTPTSDGGGFDPGIVITINPGGVFIDPGLLGTLLADITIDLKEEMRPNHTVYFLKLREPGTISAQATWGGTQANLALIINGPGQVGYYARQDGPSGLSVQYDVKPQDFAAGPIWRLSVVSFGTGTAQDGNITITYNGESVSDMFSISPTLGKVVALMRLEEPGMVTGRATWTGVPPNMAMIVNGPAQVGYYARQDGPTNLEVQYNVSNADFGTGRHWRLSLVSFEAPSISEGSLNVWYP